MALYDTDSSQAHKQLLAKVHQIGKSVIGPQADQVDREAIFPQQSIDALRELKLMGAYAPQEFGGLGLNIQQLAQLCQALGHYCGSTAMIFAMHQIQLACLVHHHLESDYIRRYLKRLTEEQRLIASATTEIRIGGDLMSSQCALEQHEGKVRLDKKAPVISYAENADDILVTARRDSQAAASDQSAILAHKGQYSLVPISSWDTLGFRGTCSQGFDISVEADPAQVLDKSFAEILSQSMQPVAHITWSSLWLGIAASAIDKARLYVKNARKRNPEAPPISMIRLAEVDAALSAMRSQVDSISHEYQSYVDAGNLAQSTSFGFTARVNHLKLNSATAVTDIVTKAMAICGIASYRNDSELSLTRHIRDAHGAALMVNNDRIMMQNTSLSLMHKGQGPQ